MIRGTQILSLVSRPVIFLFLICIGQSAVPQQASSSPAQEIQILVTALDKDQSPVKSLKAEDLRIFEDGVPQSTTEFHLMTDRPISFVVLIDTSLSQERTLDRQKLAATSFVNSILRPDRDQAAVATFTGTLTVEQKLTNDLDRLRAAIGRAKIIAPPGYIGSGVVISGFPPKSPSPASLPGATAIWDAIAGTCSEVLSQAKRDSRRSIILLSDGQDTISKSKITQAISMAIQLDVAIYSIGVGDPNFDGVNKDNLRKVSERTGGRAFFPKKVDDLLGNFGEITEALRNQYVLTYVQTTPGNSSHKLRIEIANPALKGVKLFYQQLIPSKSQR